MAELATVMGKLGQDAKKVQVLFITVDPERDTPEVMTRWLSSFHPDFLGLTGDSTSLAKVAAEFKVVYEKQTKDSGYDMSHSGGTYIFDPQGKLRLYVGNGQAADLITDDIRLLLAGS